MLQKDGKNTVLSKQYGKLTVKNFWFIRKKVEKMKIALKDRCDIQVFVIPTCSESFFNYMIYKERFPTSGNDVPIRRMHSI